MDILYRANLEVSFGKLSAVVLCIARGASEVHYEPQGPGDLWNTNFVY
jgi:hypothetical protein